MCPLRMERKIGDGVCVSREAIQKFLALAGIPSQYFVVDGARENAIAVVRERNACDLEVMAEGASRISHSCVP